MADTFAGQNWLISPAPLAVNEQPPSNITEQKWLLTLSGTYVIERKGTSDNWQFEKLKIKPDMAAPLRHAISRYGVPQPGVPTFAFLDVEQWAPFAAVGGVSVGQANDVGVTINVWRPWLIHATDVNNRSSDTILTGLELDIAVRDTKAVFHRISYHLTALGKIRFFTS